MRRSSSVIVDIVRRSSSVIVDVVRRSSSVIVDIVRRFFFSYCWRSASFLLQLLLA